MASASLGLLSWLADLLQLRNKRARCPISLSPAPPQPYCFSSLPDQDSVQGLAGLALTTDFLLLGSGHRFCAGRGWSSHRREDP